jgi:transposase-like protein
VADVGGNWQWRWGAILRKDGDEVLGMAGGLTCPRRRGARCTRFGRSSGHQRFRCGDCRRTWTETTGTPLFHLHTPLAEIVRAIRIVLRRGSLRAAEEQSGHCYETIAEWIRRLGDHSEVVTEALVHHVELSQVELDEFWSFVGKKGSAPGRQRGRATLPHARPRASAGAA